MPDFILYSIIASIVLTALVNLFPLLFPNAAEKAKRRIAQEIEQSIARSDAGERPRIKVFFPWKAMLAISLLLTVLVNLVGYFAGR